ncbi:outer membrane beta-barrel protein [Pontibacter sp. MBLB2868]|uniref:outer membrane beta-barrel protein n=1 Tax=Pontibacter sp. MBLB2868 TaxID=3451555 RepID=UPI003F74CCBC
MKTFCLTLLFAFALTFSSNAQTQKGTLMIGGSGTTNFNDGFAITLNPNLGYFFADNIAVGSSLNLSYSRVKPFRNIGIGISPFARYYFGEQAPTRLFAQANAAYSYNHNEGISSTDYSSNSYTSSSVGGGLGVVHFITEQVGLEAQFFYNNVKSQWNNDQGMSSSSPRDGRFGINFGVQIYLPRTTER